ncbi:MAG: molybdopterin molybdotransferase MoeA [Proteobacteria bacterium]|nr:molybdopterin molybdotransferase MoeA [Pseudomonadota bacterium]
MLATTGDLRLRWLIMISYAQALTAITSLTSIDATEHVPLSACLGRVLAQDLYARIPSPAFTNSAMDGYAFRYEDLKSGALKIGATLVAGVHPPNDTESVPAKGTCVRIMTGAALPAWADTVVPRESTKLTDAQDRLLITSSPSKGDNIRHLGEDLQEGSKLLAVGTYLDSERLMVAAAFGHDALTVYVRPEVVVCTTGDELIEPGMSLPFGGVYNSNKYFLRAAVQQLGLSSQFGHLVDDIEKAATSLKDLIKPGSPQFLITTGAVSAGDLDYIPELAKRLDFKTIFHKVSIRPGKPVFLAVRDQTIWLGLPGNPLATCTGWYYFARPILTAVARLPQPRRAWLTLANDVAKPEALRCFFRGTINGDQISVHSKQGSGHYSASLTNNAYVELPEGCSLITAKTRVEAITA